MPFALFKMKDYFAYFENSRERKGERIKWKKKIENSRVGC